MARVTYTNCYVNVAGYDLSSDVKSVTVQTGAEMLDDSAMGDTTKINAAGLKTWSITLNVFQDFAATKADACLNSLVGADPFMVTVKPVNEAISATNPCWSGAAVLQDYTPLAGDHGTRGMSPATLASAGDLTRLAA